MVSFAEKLHRVILSIFIYPVSSHCLDSYIFIQIRFSVYSMIHARYYLFNKEICYLRTVIVTANVSTSFSYGKPTYYESGNTFIYILILDLMSLVNSQWNYGFMGPKQLYKTLPNSIWFLCVILYINTRYTGFRETLLVLCCIFTYLNLCSFSGSYYHYCVESFRIIFLQKRLVVLFINYSI